MKICIIGCGYLGTATALKWKAEGHEITVTTRSLQRAYELKPLADLVYVLHEDFYDLVEKQDVVLLCVAPDKKNDYIQTYLHVAEALVEAVKKSSVKQIIYTSSTSIYGNHEGRWVDENTESLPIHSNAQILLSTEKILLKAAERDRQVCIFRLGEIYGPGRSIVERVHRMQGKTLPGNGENFTNLCHLDEITDALDLALKHNLDGIFNLCNDIHILRKELYDTLCKERGWIPMQWDPKISSSHGGNKRVSNEKLKSLGWTCTAKIE